VIGDGFWFLTYQLLLIYKEVMMTLKQRDKSVSLFHALSDETRLMIMARLQDGEQCVCDLTEALKTTQSRLSFHLKVLKDAGLINDRPEGRWIYYSLNADVLEELAEVIQGLQPSNHRVGSLSRRC
jgi:ArsR family transcriptional regulator, arsenate/arsenite/antimonite-responsive transcriptional repressor